MDELDVASPIRSTDTLVESVENLDDSFDGIGFSSDDYFHGESFDVQEYNGGLFFFDG
eukprot:CAMPEP_0202466796 /NCGR_PEP_ID=MMETSP1360-20130828/69928_1 /ASSEMBLY_ACC=CAM_ASM_000848 /TAXON_ID=515479 /ORGANISM="Licmophora paradoxa, Strain CCMP2313" /LENGTH=57 /DNA_ID=CAMNT_0049091067 /DNA_START=243 /DNA_END=416 /DNA_ORIENTATION=+